MPTVVASKRTLDGFIVDPLTARAFNPVIDMAKADPRVSDHNLVFVVVQGILNEKEKKEKAVSSFLLLFLLQSYNPARVHHCLHSLLHCAACCNLELPAAALHF